jgi:small subunit ribosomal protein S2
MSSSVTMRELLEAGVHFGHRKNKWNPKMNEYIFTARNGIHIIDLNQTLRSLNRYYDMVADLVADGGVVLFVGTKRQAQEIVQREAERCHMPYVNNRWLGGMLTNWRTIHARIETLKDLERRQEAGEFERLTKKEGLQLERKITKLQARLGGIRDMKKLPGMLIIVDSTMEDTAVNEANALRIPVLGIIDTNGDPDQVDYVLPANDDAMRSINLLVRTLSNAVIEGLDRRGKLAGEEEAEGIAGATIQDFDDDSQDEELLGESTLKKMREAKLFEEDDDEEDSDD